MSKSISLRDLLVCDELKHVRNEIELIHPSNDTIVHSILERIGFDIKSEIQYIVAHHRCMQNKVGVGFMAVGEMSRDRKYNKFLDAYSLTVLAGYSDISLAKELNQLMGRSIKYPKPKGTPSEPNAKKAAKYAEQYVYEDEDGEFPDNYSDGEFVDEDYENNLKTIVQLQELHDYIRGVK